MTWLSLSYFSYARVGSATSPGFASASSCDEPTIYPGEGHSVVYFRYEEIIRAMLEAWE